MLLLPRDPSAGVYGLEFVGEEDLFAAYEAKSAAAGVELIAPGLATAGSITDRVESLAYTRTAIELIGRSGAEVASARALLQAAPIEREGTVAVRARDVRGTSGISTQKAERELGRVLVDRGFTVDLEDPDHLLRVLFSSGVVDADEVAIGPIPDVVGESVDVCLVGWLAAESTRDFTDRKPTDRPFFQPGSMAPIDARAYANVAGAGAGQLVVDPMCGTGGLLIEAGLVGARVLGVDAQEKMVSGTVENLKAYLPESAEFGVVRGDATALPLCDSDVIVTDTDFDTDTVTETAADTATATATDTATETVTETATETATVDAIVFDAPYGRQSKIARHDLASLVKGALAEARRVCRSNGRAVLVADRSWREAAISAGWEVEAVFRRPVHRSLDRYVHVLTRAAEPGAENSL